MVRFRIATWNVEWAASRSTRAQLIREAILNLQPEVVCLTETHLDFLEPLGGYTITGGQGWGYQASPTRRKVLLWSREPWEAVRDEGPPQMPPDRFVAGITNTSVGKVLAYGVYNLGTPPKS
jgi:exonuclease III